MYLTRLIKYTALAILVILVNACGGGNNGAATSNNKFATEILFPTNNASLSGATQITVSGRTTDLQDGSLDANDVTSISVNGVTANLDGNGRWSAQIPLAEQNDTINVSAEYSNGETDDISINVDNRLVIAEFDPRRFVYDAANNGAFIISDGFVYRFDLSSGVVSLITNANQYMAIAFDPAGNRLFLLTQTDFSSGESQLEMLDLGTNAITSVGSLIGFVSHIIHDSANNRVLISHNGFPGPAPGVPAAIVAIDLTSGVDTTISDLNTGAGVNFSLPTGLALDSGNNRVLVQDADSRSLIAVALDTGDRSVISDNVTGAGPNFTGGDQDIVFDAANTRALVLGSAIGGGRLLAVDLSTGDRSIVSDATTGSGEPFCVAEVGGAVGDLNNNRILALSLCGAPPRIIAVDLSNGDRSNVGDLTAQSSVGTGIALEFPQDVQLDLAAGRLLVADEGLAALIAIDLGSGARSELSGPNAPTGSGPDFMILTGHSIDAGNNRIFASTFSPAALFSVNRITGDRTIISDITTGAGTSFTELTRAIYYDETNDRVIVIDDNGAALSLVAVDINSGDRSILSDSTTGLGPDLADSHSIVFDSLNSRLIIAGDNMVMAVDPASGDRSIISSDTVGTGPLLIDARSFALDAANNRILVNDNDRPAIIAVDLTSGDRSLVSGAGDNNSLGNGPLLSDNEGIAIDTQNNIAYIVDDDYPAIIQIDLSTGDRAFVALGAP